MVITQNIQISKARVMNEVAKATAYIGQKAVSAQDPGAFERIATTDANREELDRYWMEACTSANLLLDHWLVSVTTQVLSHHPEIGTAYDYNVTLGMPTNWNFAYLSSVNEALLSYLVNSIVTKWLLRVQKQDAAAYAALVAETERQLAQLMLIRKRPVRRSQSNSEDGELWIGSNMWVGSITWGS